MPVTDKTTKLLGQEFKRALGDILARVSASAPEDQPVTKLAIAFSGGLDSSALLHLAHAHAREAGIRLFAFHIHHGLSANADAWTQHCSAECEALGIYFDARRIVLEDVQKGGTEEAARNSRYAALGALCAAHGVPLLLTAHHEDDQAETVLLQLLRGAGVAGLSGMDSVNTAPGLLGDPSLMMGRPLLGVARAQLEHYVTQQAIAHVDDESNADPRYARNALRHQVMPVIAGLFPGYAQRFARSAQHAQSAQRLLIDLAAQDLAQCREGDCMRLDRMRELGTDRIDNLLRYWFGTRRMRMPSTAWLAEMRSQLLDAKADAQLCVSHPDGHIRRHRERVYLTPKRTFDPVDVAPQPFLWDGQETIAFARFGGTLHVERAGQGISAAWLRAQALELRYRSGGERLKLAPNRPTKSLKHLCQALDIPAWEREAMVIVATGTQALYAAGIGMDCHHAGADGDDNVVLRWQPDAA